MEDSDFPDLEVRLVPEDERWVPQWTNKLSAADRSLDRTGKPRDQRGIEPRSSIWGWPRTQRSR
eukprot:8259582-Pyramimonas_sp.AAC.1